MITGRLVEFKGKYYAVLNLKHPDGKRLQKRFDLELPVPNNKRRAQEKLLCLCLSPLPQKRKFFVLETKSFAQDTADKLGVSKRTVEQLVQTAANLTPEAKKTIRDAGDKITKGAALKISKLPPDQQAEAAAALTIAPPTPKRQGMRDGEAALTEFTPSVHAMSPVSNPFITGPTFSPECPFPNLTHWAIAPILSRPQSKNFLRRYCQRQ